MRTLLKPLVLLQLLCLASVFFGSCAEEQNTKAAQQPTVANFWDGYDFADTTLITPQGGGEQAIADFFALAEKSNAYEEVAVATKDMLGRAAKASPDVLRFFIDAYGRYLYDPNAPTYNENLYLPVLEYASQATGLPDYERQRFSDRLQLIKRNNPGTKATNFSFDTADGQQRDLYSLEGRYILLFFYEPGCPGCASALEDMYGLAEIPEWMSQGDLQILALYANADPELWKGYQQYIPSTWVNGMNADQSIIQHNLYDLKATPTFYLLDNRKDVLLKDRSLAEVIHYLDMAIPR